MKKTFFIVLYVVLFLAPNSAQAKFPVHLGGFIIGDDISNYTNLIDMKTCREVTYNKYLAEGEIYPGPGFKTGLIAYGLCDRPNKIVRIKLKYQDSSKKFFNKLLKQYKKRLGDPDEYKGDPFQTVIAWKWSFSNQKNERLSLTLQHNALVEDKKIGTAVKLTLTSQVEKERACFMAKKPNKDKKSHSGKAVSKNMWEFFIPY